MGFAGNSAGILLAPFPTGLGPIQQEQRTRHQAKPSQRIPVCARTAGLRQFVGGEVISDRVIQIDRARLLIPGDLCSASVFDEITGTVSGASYLRYFGEGKSSVAASGASKVISPADEPSSPLLSI